MQLHLCSWPTFFYYWKTNYPKLRVRKPIEDICSMCYIIQNTHKYGKQKQLAAPPDSDNQNSINNNPQAKDDSRDDDDEDSIIPLLINQSKSVGDSLNDNVEEDVDPDVLADVDPAIVENESKILAAAKHVIMARAQRKLFQQAIKQAREDSASKDTNNVMQQSQRSHVFVGDYCQKLELPSFCSQQPGDTHYLLPLTVNYLGTVDCSNTKDHLYA
jgi:hypothetical protein